MTTKPWMPLYVAEYRADTAHLSTAEHGAYLLLIMHYWQTGSLPADDAKLARIVGMKPVEWRKVRPTIAAFFSADWKHKRVEEELKHAEEVSQSNSKKAAEAANRRWLKHRQDEAGASVEQCSEQYPEHCSEHASSIPQAMLQNAQSQSHTSEAKASGATAPPDLKADYFRRGRNLLGKNAGGLLAKLLKSNGNEDDPKAIAKARARIEEASTKADPGEWLGRVLAGPARAITPAGELFPDGIV